MRLCKEAVGRRSHLWLIKPEIAAPLAFPATIGGGGALGDAARNDGLSHYFTIALSTHNAIIPAPIVISAFFVRHATTMAISPASKRTLVSDTST